MKFVQLLPFELLSTGEKIDTSSNGTQGADPTASTFHESIITTLLHATCFGNSILLQAFADMRGFFFLDLRAGGMENESSAVVLSGENQPGWAAGSYPREDSSSRRRRIIVVVVVAVAAVVAASLLL